MEQSLKHYAHTSQVFAISGHMYFDSHPKDPELFFLPYFFCWGWATWKRAWDCYEPQPVGWQATIKEKRHFFNCYGTFPFTKMVEKTLNGLWNTWDTQWFFCIFKNEGLVLSPYRSLTWNCGCGGGTHGDKAKDGDIALGEREYYIHGTENLEDFNKPRLSENFRFPKKISYDDKAIRLLGITFLEERLRKEKRTYFRFRRRLQLLYQRVQTLIAKRP